jgi:hypothetical protein
LVAECYWGHALKHPHHNIKVKRYDVGKKFRVWQVKRRGQGVSAQTHVRIFLVRRRGVDPVELVGQGQQLELLQRQLELPRVGDEVKEVGRALGRPVLEQILNKRLQ